MLIKKSILIFSGAIVGIACILVVGTLLNLNKVSKEIGFFEKPIVDVGRVPAGVPQRVNFGTGDGIPCP